MMNVENIEKIEVALVRCARYESSDINVAIGKLLETVRNRPLHGTKVLVKPNLLAPKPPDFLPCTNPCVVRHVCKYLIDMGSTVSVGDSPTFGHGRVIAEKIGLTKALSDLPVKIIDLDSPKLVKLSFGANIPLSRKAIENDLLVNVAKLKSHHQTCFTGAVKNVYGCVTGLGKPVLHLINGDRKKRFEKMMLEIWENLPPSVSVIDGVVAMHGAGPTNGKPFELGLLGASESAVALDTAVMSMLGLQASDAPLWKMALDKGISGARIEDIVFPLEGIESFSTSGFELPGKLYPLSFRPLPVLRFWIEKLVGK